MKKKYWIISLSSLFLLLVSASIYIYIAKPWGSPENTITESGPISIPNEILENKFGFLAGHFDGKGTPVESGSAWLRPHPGPFLWDSTQKSKKSEYTWENIDGWIKDAQEENFAVLATIWPFADWDQEDTSGCRVPDTDQFLLEEDEKDFIKDKIKGDSPNYLPHYRCNPQDWEAYKNWITAMVERYDGDGIDDMPELKIPVKYWEVLNEPDLNWNRNFPEEDETLDFFMEEPEDYAELLIITYETIKKADPTSKVLIAGAAGGNEEFLEYYEKVIQVKGVKDSFDIGNVHCISNDEFWNFNAVPYSEFLKTHSIDKPIWVTEAEALVWTDEDDNASQTLLSTQNAFNAGAERIFYTAQSFEPKFKESPPYNPNAPELEEMIKGAKGSTAFKEIFERVQ